MHVVLYLPHLVIPIQTTSQQNAVVQTALKNMISSEAVPYTNLNQRLLLSTSNMA